MGEFASWINNRFFLPLCFGLILELIKTYEKVDKMLEERKIQTKVNEYLWYIILIEFQLFGTVWAMMNVSGKPYLLLYWGFVALLLILDMCCSKDMNLEKFLKVDLVGRVVSAILLIALPLAGLYENKNFYSREIYRTYFGW